jgi:hypothetical protein
MHNKTIKLIWFFQGRKEDPCPKYRAYAYDQFLREKFISVYYARNPCYSYKEVRTFYAKFLSVFCSNQFVNITTAKLLTELSRWAINYVIRTYHTLLSIRCQVVIFQRHVPGRNYQKLLKLFRCKMYLDIDDALFLNAPPQKQYHNTIIESNDILSKQLSEFSLRTTGIIVSNDYLASWFSNYSKNIIKIPTSYCVPPDTPISSNELDINQLIIGWIGATENQLYLQNILPALTKIHADYPNMKLHIITKNHWDFDLPYIRNIEWNSDTYYKDIATLNMGLAPLADNLWCRGKMQFKALQYLAQQVATIASPIGLDMSHWTHGNNILFASTNEEWEFQIRSLIVDSSLRTKIQENGQKTVKTNYTPDVNAIKLVNLLRS